MNFKRSTVCVTGALTDSVYDPCDLRDWWLQRTACTVTSPGAHCPIGGYY